MNSASDVPQNARETAKDAREGTGGAARTASEVSDSIQRDLQALRDDLSSLAEQVGEILSSKGNAAWRKAKTSVDEAVSDAQSKGQEALDAMHEVSDRFVAAVDESLEERPYTTLALAAGLGFILGAMWRR